MRFEIEVLGKKISVEVPEGKMSLEDIYNLVCEQEIKESKMDPNKLTIKKDGKEVVIDETDVKTRASQLCKEIRMSPSEVFNEMVQEAEKREKKKTDKQKTKQADKNPETAPIIKPGKGEKTTDAKREMSAEDFIKQLAGLNQKGPKKAHVEFVEYSREGLKSP